MDDEISPYAKPITKKTKELEKNISRGLLLERWLRKCSEVFPMYGKTLSDLPGKFDVFEEALAGTSDEKINYAFGRAVKVLSVFPVPAQILEFAAEFGRPEFEIANPLFGKPPGWAPVELADARRMLAEAIEKLAAKKRMDRPPGSSTHATQRRMALERLGGSTMPADPAERAKWASDMAVKNGWKEERQPGEDD